MQVAAASNDSERIAQALAMHGRSAAPHLAAPWPDGRAASSPVAAKMTCTPICN